MIDPPGDGVEVFAGVGDRELASPAVVAQRLHGDCGPGGDSLQAIQKARGDVIVAVGEDIRFDFDRVAGDALDGKAARVDLGLHALDHDALSSIRGFLHRCDRLSGRPEARGARPHARRLWRACVSTELYEQRNRISARAMRGPEVAADGKAAAVALSCPAECWTLPRCAGARGDPPCTERVGWRHDSDEPAAHRGARERAAASRRGSSRRQSRTGGRAVP